MHPDRVSEKRFSSAQTESCHRENGSHPGDEYRFVTNGDIGSYRDEYDKVVKEAYDCDGKLIPHFESYWNKK